MQRVKFLGGLVIGVALTVFALQNMQTTQVQLLLWNVDLPLVVTIFGSAAVGAIWASLWMAMARWRKRREASKESAGNEEATPPPAT